MFKLIASFVFWIAFIYTQETTFDKVFVNEECVVLDSSIILGSI